MSFVTVLSLLIVVVSTWKGSLSSSHDAVQNSSFRVEPILGEDFEKAIVSSDPFTPTTSISGSQATITVPHASHSSLIVMTEDRGSTPNIRRACCQCQKRLLGKPGWLIEPPVPAASIGQRRKIIGVELSPFASWVIWRCTQMAIRVWLAPLEKNYIIRWIFCSSLTQRQRW